MDAKIPYEVMSADEHDRLAAIYGPLTQDVRELIEAALKTDADADSIEAARAAIRPRPTRCAAGNATRRRWCATRSGDARWCGATR